MRISAKADYAVRAAAELAAAGDERPVKGEAIAAAQGIPQNFLENILADLRHAGLVKSQRGADGGYRLARPAGEVSVADVIRAVEGPLAAVRGEAPEDVSYAGAAAPLQDVWIAVRANLRAVVEHVSLADLAAGRVPGGDRPAGRGSGRAPQALTGAFPFARSHTTSRSVSSSSSASVARELRGDRAGVAELELDAHLEAEMDDAADHRLARAVAGLAQDVDVVRAHERRRAGG